VSLVLGMLTHVAWDAFTHGDGVVVQHVAWLREPLIGAVPAGRVLQHLSTAAGLAVLTVWAARAWAVWRRDGGRLRLDRRRLAVAGALLVLGILGAVVGSAGVRGAGWEASLSAAAKDGGTVVVAAGMLAAATWWVARLVPSARHRVRQR
ncbi:MAG: DUF4184 family protein, partial [Cellulomonadaceae bacterium]|nr:DUF4184 family protein [Cellulomonadaceae bacterium]